MTESKHRLSLLIGLVVVAGIGTGGCSNPADESTAAVVGEAKPLPTPGPAAPTTTEATPVSATATEATAAGPAPALAASPESKVEFVGSKVTGSHSGGFKDVKLGLKLNAEGSGVDALAAEIDLNTIYSDNERLTGHLKSPDFFDVAKYPSATFISTEITPGGEKGASHTVTGNFTLHGVTKSLKFPATIRVEGATVSIDSDFFINRKDFGIAYAGKSDDLIRDEVVIKLALRVPKP